jgi:hypothetical protein
MDILVIEGVAPRRVAVAQYLLRAAHRVTISSSIEEAREILQFITKKSEAPDAVVIGDRLAARDDTSFREEIADRFPEAVWVPLPSDLSLQWLVDWPQGGAGQEVGGARLQRPGRRDEPGGERGGPRPLRVGRGDGAHLHVVQGRA